MTEHMTLLTWSMWAGPRLCCNWLTDSSMEVARHSSTPCSALRAQAWAERRPAVPRLYFNGEALSNSSSPAQGEVLSLSLSLSLSFSLSASLHIHTLFFPLLLPSTRPLHHYIPYIHLLSLPTLPCPLSTLFPPLCLSLSLFLLPLHHALSSAPVLPLPRCVLAAGPKGRRGIFSQSTVCCNSRGPSALARTNPPSGRGRERRREREREEEESEEGM